MQLDFTPDQEELRTSVRRVLEKECPIALVRRVVESGDEEPVDALARTLTGLDWPALALPEEVGGIGLGFVEMAVIAEELGRVIAPGPLLPTTTQFAPAVREVGTPEDQARFLGPVAAGTRTGTLAYAEDGRSWTTASIATTLTHRGDHWVLTGSKRRVVDAARVDDFAVVARSAGGLTVVVVPRDTPGVVVTRVPTTDRSRVVCNVGFTDVEVAGDQVLGEPGMAEPSLARALDEATAAVALEIVGACQTIFDTVLDYAKVRHQFGVPIGSFQAVKHKLANMFVSLERARSTCYFAAATIAEDDPRRRLAASLAKAAAGDCQRLVTQDGIQLLGGIGYTWEHDIHLYVKRAKSDEGLFGSAPAHRARVATLIGL